jgi:thioredoxin reductase
MAAMTATNRTRVCIVGAGPCGLAALKNMRAAGIENVVCYDEGTAIGGNWVFTEDPTRTSIYESTHLISSAPRSKFDDFGMPADYPWFPSHRQMRAYFESYATHFQLLPFVRLQTRVERAERRADGRWVVGLSGASAGEEIFDHLVICSGHHREPLVPEYPGRFSGEIIHSKAFKRSEPFRGKRVLVVGAGNSACDIAVDIGRVAARTCISIRRGSYIVPKVMYGRATDAQLERLRRLPRPLLNLLLRVMLRFALGPWDRYGLQAPTCGPLEMHPTLNTGILDALSNGSVLPRVGIDRLDGDVVRFSDGSAEPFDVIIWATGFRTSLPFLDASVVDWDSAAPPPLYLQMMHRSIPNIYFIGFFQPVGCIWRLADHQARIAALQIAGRLDRPADIERRIEAEIRAHVQSFDPSPRHATEVIYYDFERDLFGELGHARV